MVMIWRLVQYNTLFGQRSRSEEGRGCDQQSLVGAVRGLVNCYY